jgi:hypothetical protein
LSPLVTVVCSSQSVVSSNEGKCKRQHGTHEIFIGSRANAPLGSVAASDMPTDVNDELGLRPVATRRLEVANGGICDGDDLLSKSPSLSSSDANNSGSESDTVSSDEKRMLQASDASAPRHQPTSDGISALDCTSVQL